VYLNSFDVKPPKVWLFRVILVGQVDIHDPVTPLLKEWGSDLKFLFGRVGEKVAP